MEFLAPKTYHFSMASAKNAWEMIIYLISRAKLVHTVRNHHSWLFLSMYALSPKPIHQGYPEWLTLIPNNSRQMVFFAQSKPPLWLRVALTARVIIHFSIMPPKHAQVAPSLHSMWRMSILASFQKQTLQGWKGCLMSTLQVYLLMDCFAPNKHLSWPKNA